MKYKNETETVQTIPNVGEVEPGGIVETDVIIENPNFSVVSDSAPTVQPAPEPVATESPSEPEVTDNGGA